MLLEKFEKNLKCLKFEKGFQKKEKLSTHPSPFQPVKDRCGEPERGE
jgi:hypothetical protein